MTAPVSSKSLTQQQLDQITTELVAKSLINTVCIPQVLRLLKDSKY